MSKAGKRVKSGNPPGGAKWEQALLTAPFEEVKWKANITFVVGKKAEDYTWINILGATVAAGSRKLFSTFSKEQLYNEVRELGNPKGKKPKEVPQHYEVCEPCKTHLDAGEDIPLHLLARLLKFKLLAIKTIDLKRREAEKKAAIEKEKLRQKAAEKAAGGAPAGKERAKSPGKKGGKKTPEPQQAKEGSKLRKRGEEDPEGKYIDDEPDDGADHYIIIYGFHQPHLFNLMAELGMNPNNIIRVTTQDYDRFLPPPTEEQPIEKDEKTLMAEEAAKAEKLKLKKELVSFWRDLSPILQKTPRLHDIARKDYEVKSLLIPENLEDNEQKNNFGTSLFEDIACMVYDLIDAHRQWQNYLDNLKLIQVPVYGQPAATSPPDEKSAPATAAPTPGPQTGAPSVPSLQLDGGLEPPPVDMRYYNDLMNSVPQESVSVPVIMHCMLEQIVATDECKEPPSEQQPPKRSDGLNPELAAHLSKAAFKLALTEEEHNLLAEIIDMPERPPDVPKQPLLMNCHDDIAARTHHLKETYGFSPEAAEKDMLQRLPFRTSLEFPRPTSQVAKERAARLQELIHFSATGGLSQSEIDRAFKQFVLESMDLAGTDQNGFIITRDSEGLEHTAIPWDDPYPFFKGMIPKHEKEKEELIALTPTEERSELPLSVSFMMPNSGAQSPTPDDDKKKLTPTPPEPSSPSKEQEPGSRPSTADSRKGILRPSSRSSSRSGRRSHSPSVHFEKDQEGHRIVHMKDEETMGEEEEVVEKSTEESMNEIVDAQKRNLDTWCFAEHYEPHVLLQVMKDAIYDLPFMDMYYHKRDHSLLVVLHNPHNQEFQNHIDWHTELHSNTGFRNYLDYVEESVSEWTKGEEAKYQAQLLQKELERLREEEEASSRASAKARQKSARKGGSRSKSPKGGSRGSSQERPTSASSNIFIREGSIKAWKIEQERLKAEEDEKERVKSAKRSKSPKKKEEKEDKKRAGSAKSKSSSQKDGEEPTPPDQEPQTEERYYPFMGYDTGNNLIHVSGITTTLFPSDGGQIRTERTEFVQGTTAVKTTVHKDGHTFTVHVLDPKEPSEEDEEEVEEEKTEGVEKAESEKQEKDVPSTESKESQGPIDALSQKSIKSTTIKTGTFEKPPSVSAFGSITGHLFDGMTLALSQFGQTGEAVDGKKPEPEPYVPPVTESPVPPPSPTKSKKGDKKGDKTGSTPEPPPPPPVEEEKVEVEEEEKIPEQPFQQLFVSCPDGLNVRYLLESHVGMRPLSEDDRRLLVKQSFPFKTKGTQSCEASRRKYALSEVSRVISSEGTIVKNMVDGSVEVLYADGTFSVHTGNWPLPRSRESSPQRGGSAKSQSGDKPETPTQKKGGTDRSRKGIKGLSTETTDTAPEEKISTWVTTYPSGERVQYKADGSMEELKPIMICQASDPETSQSMATRDDHVITISYPDGTTIVEHADGTRITTYYRESQVAISEEEADATGETRDYDMQTIKFVKVECPAYATVEFNCMTSENLTIFGNGTTVNVFPDGYYMLHHYDGGRLEVDTEGIVTYFPRPNKNMEQLLPERELRYMLAHNADVVVETVDPEGNIFNVKNNGDFSVIPVNADDVSETSSEDQSKGDKKITVYKEHAPRFFIVHSDCSGTELLRYQDFAEYLTSAEQSPATAVLRDDLPNFPGVLGITILKPYLGGPSERWFKKYDQESIIPPGIRCRDLTTLPPKEFKVPGPRFGTNVGQGLNVGAAVKAPLRIPILKCPDILELRQFVQYKPVSEELRQHLHTGLQEYAEYVRARNKASELMQVMDPRSEEERINAADLQSVMKQTSADEEIPKYEEADVKEIYEKAMSPPVPSPPPTPQPKRSQADWERDQRELAEEIEGRNALRNKNIPRYFDSEFGKAFLLTQAKDINEMVHHLSEDPRKDGSEAVRGDTFLSKQTGPPSASQLGKSVAINSESSSPSSMAQPKVAETPVSYAVYSEVTHSAAGVRPGNPTPAHGMGQGSPAPLRPQNPTPVHAGKTEKGRPGNPTPKMAGGTESPSDLPSHLDYPIIMEQPHLEEEMEMPTSDRELSMTKSLRVNVIGQPRQESVPLPNVIKGGRPGAIPNTKFSDVEDPVRRKIQNSLIAGATVKGQTQLQKMRGLNLLPEEADFGVLKEGNTYVFTVSLKNTGVDSCRFRIKQPPPATGLRVVYSPGPVAAGMKTELDLELYAIAVGVEGETGVGSIRHDLEIVTETDVLFLPITATVLTADEYENRSVNSPRGGKSPGARLVSTKPPSTTGIIRPRKPLQPGIPAGVKVK